MKKLFAAIAFLAIVASCCQINVKGGKPVICKGPVVEKDIEGLEGFDAITVNGSMDLYYSQTNTYSVCVKANAEVFDYLDYKVENGVLTLDSKDNVNIRADEYKVTVTLPVLSKIQINGAADVIQQGEYSSEQPMKIHVNGAGDFSLKEKLSVPSITIQVNGAGDIRIPNMEVDELYIKINGAGDAVLGGKAGLAHFAVNGAGDIDARTLECEKVITQKNGISSIRM